jgi:DNA-binding Xre family transcriptional regulator
LKFRKLSIIIKYNAVGVEYTVRQVSEKQALPISAGLFAYQGRRILMAVSYKKLWKLLIDKDMKKKDLCIKAGISSASVTKMGKNGHVTTEVLLKICTALNCGVDDIMEIVPE